MKFGFIARHRGICPAAWLCEALGVSPDTSPSQWWNQSLIMTCSSSPVRWSIRTMFAG